jgi:hypothetical protein
MRVFAIDLLGYGYRRVAADFELKARLRCD